MPKPTLLLQTCCAPCSGFLVSQLAADFLVTVYYTNSNIYPKSEFELRKKEAKDYFDKQGIEFIISDYNHENWIEKIKGLEKEPERGKRCERCYYYRLKDTADYAKSNNYDFFGSTLSISPHKVAETINRIGVELEEETGIKFLAEDWKKKERFKKAMELAKKHNFYRQDYCGCEFSH